MRADRASFKFGRAGPPASLSFVVRKATEMTCQNATFALVLTSLLAGCDKQTPSNPGKQSDVPATRYQVFVESSGSETVDALVRQLVSNRPAPYPSGTPDTPGAVQFEKIHDPRGSNRHEEAEIDGAGYIPCACEARLGRSLFL